MYIVADRSSWHCGCPLSQVLAVDSNGDDTSLTATAAITILLQDVNDNAPVFDQDLYEFWINEDTSPGLPVGSVRVYDLDVAPNNRILYSLLEGGEGRFYVDRITGKIVKSMQYAI